MIALLAACGDAAAPPTVLVSPDAYILKAGKTVALEVTVRDGAGELVANPVVEWTSSATAVATVSPGGVVNAVDGGTATIRATYQGVTAAAAISVLPTANGRWRGSADRFTFTVVLSESDNGALTGSGTVANGGTTPITVTGNHPHPAVSLTMHATGFQNMYFTGSFTTNERISGAVNGSGFSNLQLVLNRS